MKRKKGYYWVATFKGSSNIWDIAYWNDGYFTLPGDQSRYYDSNFDEIDEKPIER